MGKDLNQKKLTKFVKALAGLTDWSQTFSKKYLFRQSNEWPFDPEFKKALSRKDADKFLRINLVPIDMISVNIKDLYVQFRSEWPIQEYSDNPNARVPLKLIDSPLADFIKSYQNIGRNVVSQKNFKTLSYYEMWKKINKVGFKYDWYNYPIQISKSYSDELIIKKMAKFIKVYESIKKNGYLGGKFREGMIQILVQPFENSKFGCKHEIDGYEIWSGHHRAAALFCLGVNKVEVLVLRTEKTNDRGEFL